MAKNTAYPIHILWINANATGPNGRVKRRITIHITRNDHHAHHRQNCVATYFTQSNLNTPF